MKTYDKVDPHGQRAEEAGRWNVEFLRLLTAGVACSCLFVFGGCRSGDDVYVGTFEQYLRDVQLEAIVRLDDQDSLLTLNLFRGRHGELRGEMYFDGDVQIMGFDVWDIGYDPYPVTDLTLEDEVLKGVVNIPDFFLNARFKGEFIDDYWALDINVHHLGQGKMWRVEDEEDSDDDVDGPEEE